MKKFFLTIALFLLIGCGGGNSNSLPLTPKDSQMASLENIDTKKGAKSAFDAIKIEDSATSFPSFKIITPSQKFLKKIGSFFTKNFRLIDKSYLCESGSAKVDYYSNNDVIVYFDNCEADGILYDGKAEIIKHSDNSKEVTFRNFSIQDMNGYNLKIDYSVWLLLNSSNIAINQLYATAIWHNQTFKYLNFSMHIITNETITSLFNGYIYTNCLNGFVKVQSKNGLTYQGQDVSGEMELSSKGKKVTIDFAKDPNDENSPTYVYITNINGVQESLTLAAFKQIKCN